MYLIDARRAVLTTKISTGELSSDAAKLEGQLTRIFQTAHTWDALLLLDEADVFLQRRAKLSLERNRLVAVFLRKLEYYDGLLILTTNLVHQFDDAILNRVHLTMKYEKLKKAARETIITHFLESVNGGQGLSNVGTEYVGRFACVPLNGRQVSHPPLKEQNICLHGIKIKNTIAIATALAAAKSEDISSLHISQALGANGDSVPVSDTDSDGLYD